MSASKHEGGDHLGPTDGDQDRGDRHMIYQICWAILGLIHLMPALALFQPQLLTRIYGIQAGTDAVLLMHHRAALFLVVVIIAVWAALRPEVRPLATVALGLSMGSFLILWWIAGASPALRTIALADLIGLPVLLVAGWQAFQKG